MSREDQYSVSVAVDGVDTGVWDSFEGGALDSEETKYKPGGMQPQVSLGGTRAVDNVTIGRLYDLNRDHPLVPWLNSRVGKGQVTVTKQPLDIDGNIFGRPLVYTGKLKTVTPPDHDSESDDAAKIELEVSTAGSVA